MFNKNDKEGKEDMADLTPSKTPSPNTDTPSAGTRQSYYYKNEIAYYLNL